ncbi:MAG: hypothetical protein ACYC8T_10510 [Myxococcaceae bacterium]
MSPVRATALLVSLLALAGCGPKRVPSDLLNRLPYEARIELLEAENDFALAIDHLDGAQAEILQTRDTLRRAKDRLSAAEGEVSRAEDKVSEEVATLAVAEAEARVDYLRARQDVNVENERVVKRSLRCAQARFEQARLTVARKAKIEGSESLSVEDFDEQVKACDAEVAELKAEMKEVSTAAAAAKESWEKQKSALAKKTFDARASPYVE